MTTRAAAALHPMWISTCMSADARHSGLKHLAARFGVHSSAFLWQSIATRRHRRKLQLDPQYRAWIEARQGLADHWGHETVSDTFGLLHAGSQLYEICRKLRHRIRAAHAHHCAARRLA